ncbi:hypothetical protein [Streptomyces chrestomyceticus]|uniref:hypothetical protein n=1 Tax=Streptomyces chrestomyceticus TaxID=68185 RepID=UPI0033C08CBF
MRVTSERKPQHSVALHCRTVAAERNKKSRPFLWLDGGLSFTVRIPSDTTA